MNATETEPLPLQFLRSVAVQVRRSGGPQSTNAKLLLRLLRLRRFLEGDGSPLAQGLVVALEPALRAAAARLGLGC